MLCPAGSVNVSDQPLIGVLPVLAMVIDEVSPVFQALTVSVTRHAPAGGGLVGGGLVGGGLVGGGLVGGGLVGGGLVGGALVGGALVGGGLVGPVPSRPKKEIAICACPLSGKE